MYARASTAPPLGAWWNSLSDLTHDVVHIVGGEIAHPGLPDIPSDPAPTQQQQDTDDFGVIQAWVADVHFRGAMATRMPTGMPNAGELAERSSGPGTAYPDATPPFTYTLAPDDVRNADARIRDKDTFSRLISALVPVEKSTLNAASDFLGTLKTYGLYIAGGAVVLYLLPSLLARRR